MNILELSEQEIVRRQSLQELRQMGINPYPAAEYPTNAFSTEIRNNVESGKWVIETTPAEGEEPQMLPVEELPKVCIAGRMMSRRVMGKASFAEIQDSKGRIQVYVSRDELCPDENKDLYNVVFKRLLDIGDFIGVKGYLWIDQLNRNLTRKHKL